MKYKVPTLWIAFTAVLLAVIIAANLAACDIVNPTPPPPPPTDTVEPAPPTEIPLPTWLLECKQTKCPVFITTGDNDSGLPIVAINSGDKFYLGEKVQFHFPCVMADGGDMACEVYRDIDGHIYPPGRYVWRDQLRKVY